MKAWYTFCTRAGYEILVCRLFNASGVKAYLPLLWSDDDSLAARPLFPHYLFVYCDLAAEEGTIFRRMGALGALVAFGGRPAVVREEAIQLIRARGCLSGSSGTPVAGSMKPRGALARLAMSLSVDVPAYARVRALLIYLGETNATTPSQAEQQTEADRQVPLLRRWTRGRGRRIRYKE